MIIFSFRRATSFAERLHLGLAVIHGVRQEAESEMCDGRTSPPPVQKKTFAYPLPGNIAGIGTCLKVWLNECFVRVDKRVYHEV